MYREVIEAGIPAELQGLAFLNVNRQVNMVGARASDAARDEVRDYERLGALGYREQSEAIR